VVINLIKSATFLPWLIQYAQNYCVTKFLFKDFRVIIVLFIYIYLFIFNRTKHILSRTGNVYVVEEGKWVSIPKPCDCCTSFTCED